MSTVSLPFLALPRCTIDAVRLVDTTLVIEAHTVGTTATCPDCQQPATRIHSSYERRLRDLPVCEQSARLHLKVRRFFCTTVACMRLTFTERLPDVAPLHAQRTFRLT